MELTGCCCFDDNDDDVDVIIVFIIVIIIFLINQTIKINYNNNYCYYLSVWLLLVVFVRYQFSSNVLLLLF